MGARPADIARPRPRTKTGAESRRRRRCFTYIAPLVGVKQKNDEETNNANLNH